MLTSRGRLIGCVVGIAGCLILGFLMVIGEIHHDREVDALKRQISVLEDQYKELDIKKSTAEYEYDKKIKKLQDKINELNADIVILQEENDELRNDNQGLRLQVDELSTSYVESYDQPMLESENPTLIASAMAIRTENTYMEELGDDSITHKVDPNPAPTGAHLTRDGGTFDFEGHSETWYNLDMTVVVQVAQSKGIAGEYHVRSDGAKMLGDYIMVAACYDVHPYGSLVNTSLGMGIVVDTGGFVAWNPAGIDIATTW